MRNDPPCQFRLPGPCSSANERNVRSTFGSSQSLSAPDSRSCSHVLQQADQRPLLRIGLLQRLEEGDDLGQAAAQPGVFEVADDVELEVRQLQADAAHAAGAGRAERDVARRQAAPQVEQRVGALGKIVGHGDGHWPAQATSAAAPLPPALPSRGALRSASVAAWSSWPLPSSATR